MRSVICNWKMNPTTFVEAKRLFDATKVLATSVKKVDVVVAPPSIFLRELAKGYKGARVEFSAQNISTERSGSYTGEIAAAQVRDAGATHTIIGHAERRALGETDEQVGKKVLLALENKMDAIVAVGESERNEHGDYVQIVRNQIITALKDIPSARFKNITIAYEPIWAIGAPTAPSANEVHQMMLLVRRTIRDAFGDKALKAIRVVYGGAVNEGNAQEIFSVPDLDGVLIGRASLDPNKLKDILHAAQNA